jgi:hypothetical protein
LQNQPKTNQKQTKKIPSEISLRSPAKSSNITAGQSLKLTLLNLPNVTEYSNKAIRIKEYSLPMNAYIICPENFTFKVGKFVNKLDFIS